MAVVAHADWQRTTLLLYYLSTPTQKQQQSNNKATTPPNKNNNHWRLINKDHDIRLYNSWLSPSHVRVITMLHLLWNLNFNITTPSALMHKTWARAAHAVTVKTWVSRSNSHCHDSHHPMCMLLLRYIWYWTWSSVSLRAVRWCVKVWACAAHAVTVKTWLSRSNSLCLYSR